MTEKKEKKEKKGDTVDKAIKDFYEDYGITSNNNKDLKNQELFNLYKIPKKDKELNQTHFQNYEPMKVQQADILYLPEDKGYKYALVVTDIGTRLTDAKPLKSKSSTEVVKAFENIYSGNILKKPKKIESDQGTEFKGELTKYLKKNNIYIRYGKTNRHKQQAIVERKNQTIGTALSKRMQAQELLTNEVSTEWKDDLPKVINAINRKAKKTKIKRKKNKIKNNNKKFLAQKLGVKWEIEHKKTCSAASTLQLVLINSGTRLLSLWHRQRINSKNNPHIKPQ